MWQFLEYGFFVQARGCGTAERVLGSDRHIHHKPPHGGYFGRHHARLFPGGLGLGYYLGISPVLMAAVFAIGSSLGVDALSSRLRLREDSAIAVVWSSAWLLACCSYL